MTSEKVEYRPASFRYTMTGGYCAFPVGGDTYHNCPNACLYCFEIQANNQHLRDKQIKPRDYKTLFNSLYEDPEVRYFVIEKKVPIQVGVSSDPFPALEKEVGATLSLIELCAKAGIQMQFSTKCPDNITDEHIAAMKKLDKVAVRVSFSSLDDTKSRYMEPGAVVASERLRHMRRLNDAGIEVAGRLAPWLRTENYDYNLFAQAGCSNVTVDPFRFSTVWRHSFPPRFWEVVMGERRPDGDAAKEMKRKDSPMRRWAEAKEREYFAPLQDLEKHPYHSDGTHWIYTDIHKMREAYLRDQKKCHDAGMLWGICCIGSGIHNIDLNDPPCPCISKGWRYDTGALVPAWFKNKWADYRVPAMDDYEQDVAIERVIIANSDFYRPIAASGGHKDQAVICDAPVHIEGEMR